MKILHLTTHLNAGGITRYLLNLIPAQRDLGNHVTVWGARGDWAGEIRSVSEEVFESVPRTKSELSPRLWLSLPGLLSILKEQAVDLMHAHTRVTQVLAQSASWLTRIPFVTTAHGFYGPRLGRRLFPSWGRGIFAISRSVRDGLLDTFGVGSLPLIEVVPNGVDSEGLEEKILRQNREEVRSRYSFTQEDIVILSLSRLRPSKGIHYLITAFQKAKREIPNLKLLIGGGGDDSYQKELEQQCQDLSIMKEVRFLGNISQIEEPLRAADIFAAPYTSPEGFGLSVLEALTARLPVVASDIDGLTELLEGGELGVLFEEKNVEALKKALIQLAGDADLRQALALKGAKSCRKYSSHRMAENIQKIYEQVHRRAL